MKKFNTFFTIVCICLLAAFCGHESAEAQNWNPFAGGTALYKYTDPNAFNPLLYGARVVSSGMSGTDSVYYLNKINQIQQSGQPANGCNGALYFIPGSWLMEQDNLFGDRMVFGTDGDYHFLTSAGDTFLIRTQVAPGSSWTFASGITATLASIQAGTLLGVPDSIMRINLSNNREILLSKSHGFLKAYTFLPVIDELNNPQEYVLDIWGLPEMNLGRRLPTVQEVFDYDIGDKFGKHYHTTEVFDYDNWQRIEETIVTGKQNYADSVVYQVTIERVNIVIVPYISYDTTYHAPVADTIVIHYSDYDYLDLLPLESDTSRAVGQFGYAVDQYANNRVKSRFMDIFELDTCAPAFSYQPFYNNTFILMDGLGNISFGGEQNGYAESMDMFCYTKITDSLGPCPDLSTLLPVEEGIAADFQWTVGPVPSPGLLKVTFENQPFAASLELHLLDLQGKIIRQWTLQAGTHEATLDLEMIAEGMYLLQAKDENGLRAQKKIVVQR